MEIDFNKLKQKLKINDDLLTLLKENKSKRLFSKYKVVNDKNVHDAVMLSLTAMKIVPGAQYFTYKGKLIIAYAWDTNVKGLLSDIPNFQDGVNALMNNIPRSYGKHIDIWDIQHQAGVPEDILEKTGYVSLCHPENNRE